MNRFFIDDTPIENILSFSGFTALSDALSRSKTGKSRVHALGAAGPAKLKSGRSADTGQWFTSFALGF
jgi:hypothetical protein